VTQNSPICPIGNWVTAECTHLSIQILVKAVKYRGNHIFGGSVLQSDYYIVGGITELNFNIQSGGAELSVNNVGGKGRIYTMNISVDLRIVGSQSFRVFDTVSIQKQISGYEIGTDVFRFFGSDLWDVNAGAKSQEPLQLAVRMAIESALLEIVPTVTGVEPTGVPTCSAACGRRQLPRRRQVLG